MLRNDTLLRSTLDSHVASCSPFQEQFLLLQYIFKGLPGTHRTEWHVALCVHVCVCVYINIVKMI